MQAKRSAFCKKQNICAFKKKKKIFIRELEFLNIPVLKQPEQCDQGCYANHRTGRN